MLKKTKGIFRFCIIVCCIMGFLGAGVFLLWAATLTMPSWESLETRRVEQSSKIYDRTGMVLLYDLHQDVRRTVVPIEEMSRHIKNATVAIEDDNFYNHRGVEPTAILRAIFYNFRSGELLRGQGGSTITQQVVKNTLLEKEKLLSRKLKEWILAIKLEQRLSKEQILELYLNESPYGGNRYGVEEASRAFFDKSSSELTIAEAAYLASLPQAPTYLSPYGNNRGKLEERKNLTLSRMLKLGFITEEEYDSAVAEEVFFQPQRNTGIQAPHFVFFVIETLRELYTERELSEGGLRIITTLDWNLQEAGERIVKQYALENSEKFDAENAALVAIEPSTGDILTMVGSRDYFDEQIPGNYNIALAHRQPGSSFKPFVYAEALRKGYTSETVVFDVATQFSTTCPPDRFTSEDGCYSPVNYDGVFRGPMTFRNALAQSVNIPAVKALYLAGIADSIKLARSLGISTLTDPARYGLTLVLGGGEVRLLDMTSAYGVFAHEGVRAEPRAVIRIEDRSGRILREFTTRKERVLEAEISQTITNILADNVARTPAFGANSFLHFPGRDVAAKTGTTNDYRDAWIIGYTPEIVVGAWAGNNDNRSMEKRVAGFIIAPLWHAFMLEAFERIGNTSSFTPPPPLPADLKPILRGVWNIPTYLPSTEEETTPQANNIHSILHWVDRNDPRGPVPTAPARDPQYVLWEYGVSVWKAGQPSYLLSPAIIEDEEREGERDEEQNVPQTTRVKIERPRPNETYAPNSRVVIRTTVEAGGRPSVARVDIFLNDVFLETISLPPYQTVLPLSEYPNLPTKNTITARVVDSSGVTHSHSIVFFVE